MGCLVERKAALIAVVAFVALAFYGLELHSGLTVAALQGHYEHVQALYDAHPVLFVLGFFTLQVLALTQCMPGAVLMPAMIAGAVFGTALGTSIALAALTLGDSLAFLTARYLARNWVRERFGGQLSLVDQRVAEDGAVYLLALRLAGFIPYFVVNLTLALTPMRLRVFAPVSFVGLVPVTVLHVYAGTTMSRVHSLRDVMSLPLVLTFAVLGLLPLAARFWWKREETHNSTPGSTRTFSAGETCR